jgi:CDP-paratose 2-epimerase
MEIKQGKLNELFTISGNGKQVRDLLYASDTVNLYLAATTQIDLLSGEMFCVGGGMKNSSSLLELFVFLENELGINMTYDKLSPRESDQKVFVADNRKAKEMIGWQPAVDKELGVRKMIEWIKGQ